MVPEWLQGTKKEPFGSLWGVFEGCFGCILGLIFVQHVMHFVKVVVASIRIFD